MIAAFYAGVIVSFLLIWIIVGHVLLTNLVLLVAELFVLGRIAEHAKRYPPRRWH